MADTADTSAISEVNTVDQTVADLQPEATQDVVAPNPEVDQTTVEANPNAEIVTDAQVADNTVEDKKDDVNDNTVSAAETTDEAVTASKEEGGDKVEDAGNEAASTAEQPNGNGTTKDDQDKESTADSKPAGQHTNFVRLRGLPFSVTEGRIREFLKNVRPLNVTLIKDRDGRLSGECFCELEDKESVEKALEHNREEIDSRYVEVFTVTADDLYHMKQRGIVSDEDKILRLRGLPFSATTRDIMDFFEGLVVDEVVIGRVGGRPSGEAYCRMSTKEHASKALDFNKKNLGSRYVEVFRTTVDDMERHRAPDAPIGTGVYHGVRPGDREGVRPRANYYPNRNRGVEYDDYGYGRGGGGGPAWGGRGGRGGGYRHSPYEVPPGYGGGRYEDDYGSPYDRRSQGYGGGRGRGAVGGYGGPERGDRRDSYGAAPRGGLVGRGGPVDAADSTKVYMRGIPFDASSYMFEDFFTPLHLVEVKIGFNEEGRPAGVGCVQFANEDDAYSAMSRNNQNMGRRYVELFSSYDKPPPMRHMTWKVIGGKPTPKSAASVPSATARAYGGYNSAAGDGYVAGYGDHYAGYAAYGEQRGGAAAAAAGGAYDYDYGGYERSGAGGAGAESQPQGYGRQSYGSRGYSGGYGERGAGGYY